MRLRTLALSLCLVGFSGIGSHAQSVTGLASPRFQPGFQFVANQYRDGNNTVARLIANPAEGTELYKITNGSFTTNTFRSGSWKTPGETLEPGEGAIVFNPSTNLFRGTFAGEILQGNLVNHIPAGVSLKSSMLPQVGGVTSALGLKLSPFDNVYQWKTNHFEVYTFLPDGNWFPSEPTIGVTEAFVVRANREVNWARTFQINR